FTLPATTERYPLSLHDALPICTRTYSRPPTDRAGLAGPATVNYEAVLVGLPDAVIAVDTSLRIVFRNSAAEVLTERSARRAEGRDRKSTRLNSSHVAISYAVFC